MDSSILRISRKLKEASKRKGKPFGYQGHRFQLNSPLTVDQVELFEMKYDIILPEEYKMFITQLGDGGVGPAYGLFKLNVAVKKRFGHVTCDNIPEDILKIPFAHTEAYNPENDPQWIEIENLYNLGELSDKDYEDLVIYQKAGTLTLCHEGCGYVHIMVVSGSTAGQIWIDGTCSDQGFIPLKVSFLDWYERWLDSFLAGKDGIWWFEN